MRALAEVTRRQRSVSCRVSCLDFAELGFLLLLLFIFGIPLFCPLAPTWRCSTGGEIQIVVDD